MMQMVVYTEAFFFLCLITAYIYMAYTSGFEPHELSRLDIHTTGIYTILLIASSFTLHLAERGQRRGHMGALKAWLLLTLVLGAIFLIGQGLEYARLIRDRVTVHGSVFGTSFFTLTGFHGFHVLCGLVILAILLALTVRDDRSPSGAAVSAEDSRRPPSSDTLGSVALYWHFVDVVWIFVFTVVYILPRFSSF
jgi:heme/copper-type cytochrome/quinol oxidase subunit 3